VSLIAYGGYGDRKKFPPANEKIPPAAGEIEELHSHLRGHPAAVSLAHLRIRKRENFPIKLQFSPKTRAYRTYMLVPTTYVAAAYAGAARTIPAYSHRLCLSQKLCLQRQFLSAPVV